jgi:hypothetical protein
VTSRRADTSLTPGADVALQSQDGSDGRVVEPAVNGSAAAARKLAICGAKRRQGGGPCGRHAGWGTSHPGYGHCRDHGGASPGGVKYAARLAIAEQARAVVGPVEIEPMDAIAELLAAANGRRMYVAELREAVAAGKPVDLALLDVYLGLEDENSDRMARLAKMLLDAGHEERRVQVQELVGERVAVVLRAFADRLGLTDTAEGRARVRAGLAEVLPLLNAPAGATGSADGRELIA